MTEPGPFENLRYAVADGVATVTVARPKAMNALNGRTLDELARAFAAIATDPAVKAVIVTGDGEKAFVAGADIAELAAMTPGEARAASEKGRGRFEGIGACGRIAAGAATGGASAGDWSSRSRATSASRAPRRSSACPRCRSR